MIDTAQAAVGPHGNQGAQDEGEDLFGDVDLSSLALIGTSYSRTSEFASFLKSDLGTLVPDFENGLGWPSLFHLLHLPHLKRNVETEKPKAVWNHDGYSSTPTVQRELVASSGTL